MGAKDRLRQALPTIAPRLLVLSILATVSISLYRLFFGEGRVTELIYPVNVALWIATIIVGLLLGISQRETRLRQYPVQKSRATRARQMMWFGILAGILPIPWLMLATWVWRGSSPLLDALAVVPALCFAIVGITLIFYPLAVEIVKYFRR